MRSKLAAVIILTLAVTASWFWVSRTRRVNATPTVPGTGRQSVELTVYNQDFGMVREVRPVQLTVGNSRLQLLDVSKQLDPHSVLLRWQGSPQNAPQLIAHSYDLGVADGAGLLKRYLGKEVEIVRYDANGREARQRGTLMVEAHGQVVVQTDGKFYVSPNGTVVAPTHGEIVTIPQLSVTAESRAAQALNLEVAYLTRGLSWSADYVATLSPQNTSLALECWASLTNRTGVDYPNARVLLVAGAPNRAASPVAVAARHSLSGGAPGTPVPEAEARSDMGYQYKVLSAGPPEAFGDFHTYPIRVPATVAQEQMNRLLVLAAARVPIGSEYTARLPGLSSWDDAFAWELPNERLHGSVQVALTFFNEAKNGLGVPLPAGTVRVYQPDSMGSLRYAGAATIPNTPQRQKIHLTLARAFDVFTESRVLKSQRVRKHTTRKQIEVVLHNEKITPVDLRVVQGVYGRWKIIGETHRHVTLDASNAQWRVSVPASGQATLRYTVDLSG